MGHEAPDDKKEFIDLLDFSKEEPSSGPGAGVPWASRTREDAGVSSPEPVAPRKKRLELEIGSRYLQTFSVILVSTAFVILGYYPSSYLPLGFQVLLMFSGGAILLLFGDHLYAYDKNFQLYAKSLIFGGVKIEYTALWSLHFHYELVGLEFFSGLVLIMLAVHYLFSFRYHSELLQLSAILVVFIFTTILHATGIIGDTAYLALLLLILLGNITMGLVRKSPTVTFSSFAFLYVWLVLHHTLSGTVVFNLDFTVIESRSLLVAVYSIMLVLCLLLFACHYHENSMLSMVTPKTGLLSKLRKVRFLYAPLLLVAGITSFPLFQDNAPLALLLFSTAIYGALRVYFLREIGQTKSVTLFHISLFMAFLLTLFFYELDRGETAGAAKQLISIFSVVSFFTLGFLFYYDDEYWLRDFTRLVSRTREKASSRRKGTQDKADKEGTREAKGKTTTGPDDGDGQRVEQSVRGFIWIFLAVSGVLVGLGYSYLETDMAYHFSFLLLVALMFEAVLHIRQLSVMVVYGSYLFLLFSVTGITILAPGGRAVGLAAVPLVLVYLLYSELIKKGRDSRNLVFLALLWLALSAFFLKEFTYPVYLIFVATAAFLVLRPHREQELFGNLDASSPDLSSSSSSSSSASSPSTTPPPAPSKLFSYNSSAEPFFTWLNSRLKIYLYSFRKYNLLSFWNLGLLLLLANGTISLELYHKRDHLLFTPGGLSFPGAPDGLWSGVSLLLFLVLPTIVFLASYFRYAGTRGRLVLPVLVFVFTLPTLFRYGFSFGPLLFYMLLISSLFLYERHVHDETTITFLFLLLATALVSELLGISGSSLTFLWLLFILSLFLDFSFYDHFKHGFQNGLVVMGIFFLFASVTTLQDVSALFVFVCFFLLFLFYLAIAPVAHRLYPRLYARYVKSFNPFESTRFRPKDENELRQYRKRSRFEFERGKEFGVLVLLVCFFYVFIILFSYLEKIAVLEAMGANTLLVIVLAVNLIILRRSHGAVPPIHKESPKPGKARPKSDDNTRRAKGEADTTTRDTGETPAVTRLYPHGERPYPNPAAAIGEQHRRRKREKRFLSFSKLRQRATMSYSEMTILLSPALLITGFREFDVLKYYFLAVFVFGLAFFLWYKKRSEVEFREFTLTASLSLIYFSFLYVYVSGRMDFTGIFSLGFDMLVSFVLLYYLLLVTSYLYPARGSGRFLDALRSRLFHNQKAEYPWYLTLFLLIFLTTSSMSFAIVLVPVLFFVFSLLKKDFLSFSVSYIFLLVISYYFMLGVLNFASSDAKRVVIFLFFFLLLIGIVNELVISGEPITFASSVVSACLMIAVVFLVADSIETTMIWSLYWGTAFSAGLHLDKQYLRSFGLFYLFLGLMKILYDLNKIGWERTVLALLLFGFMGIVSAYYYKKQDVKEGKA